MTILLAYEIDQLDSILRELKYLDEVDSSETLTDLIEWLTGFLKDQPVAELRSALAKARNETDEAKTAYQLLVQDYAIAKAGIESLKHLQKYEGHQKAESDALGHQAEIALLKNEIERLRNELAQHG